MEPTHARNANGFGYENSGPELNIAEGGHMAVPMNLGEGSSSDERVEERTNPCGHPLNIKLTSRARSFDGLFAVVPRSVTAPESHFAQINFDDPPTG